MIDISKGKYWDVAWNPIRCKGGGYRCTPCSPGCQNCWAMTMTKRFDDLKPKSQEFEIDKKAIEKPFHWKKPRVVAVQWMGDLFHEDIPERIIKEAFATIKICSNHTYLVLTKRAGRMIWMKNVIEVGTNYTCDNIWLGVSVCNQQEADEKIPLLLETPAAHRWISIEPLLSPVEYDYKGLSQVVVGGETGHNARPVHPDWVRRIRDDCQAVGVPFFLKKIDKKSGRILDGRTHDELAWMK